MPFIASRRAISPDRYGILAAKFTDLKPAGLVANNDATLGQNILDIPQAQAEPEIEPDSVFDDF